MIPCKSTLIERVVLSLMPSRKEWEGDGKEWKKKVFYVGKVAFDNVIHKPCLSCPSRVLELVKQHSGVLLLTCGNIK